MASEIEIFSAMSDDGLQALIEFEEGGKIIARKILSPDELSEHIRLLGKLRATMADPIPRKLDALPVFRDVTREAVLHVNRQNKVGKEFFIACRHEGFGWLAFAMNAESGELLANMINRQVDEMRPIKLPKKGIIT